MKLLLCCCLLLCACGDHNSGIELTERDEQGAVAHRTLAAGDASTFESALAQLDASGLPERNSASAGEVLAGLRPDLHASEFGRADDGSAQLYRNWWIEQADFDGKSPADYLAVLVHFGSSGFYEMQAVVRSSAETRSHILRSGLRGVHNLYAHLSRCGAGQTSDLARVRAALEEELVTDSFVGRFDEGSLDSIRVYREVRFGPPELGAMGFVSLPEFVCWNREGSRFERCPAMAGHYRRVWRPIIAQLRDLCTHGGGLEFIDATSEFIGRIAERPTSGHSS